MRGGSWVLGLALLAGSAAAQEEGRAVRLELSGGEVLEGRLDGFERRVYRLRLADGRVREVPEQDVKRLELLGQAAAGRVSACQALADVLRRAEASGVLTERVLGTHWFLFTDEDQDPPHHTGERRGPSQYLLEVTLRLEAAPAGEGRRLLVQLETLTRPGTGGSAAFLGLRGPTRFGTWLDPSDGRVARIEFLQPSKRVEGVAVREGDQLRATFRERDRSGSADLPWDDDLLPDGAVYFLLAPLLDQGFPPGFSFRLLEGLKSRAGEAHRLRSLPGARPAPGGKATVIEHVAERGDEPMRDSTRVFVGSEGSWRGQVVRLETESWGTFNEVEYVTRTTTGERIDRERFEALVKEWGAERAPQRTPAPEVVQPMVQLPPGPLADLLRGARQQGALAPLLGERWFVARTSRKDADRWAKLAAEQPGSTELAERARAAATAAEQVRLTRIQGRLEGERLVVEVRLETVGDPEGAEERRLEWDPEGRLVALSGRERSLSGGEQTWQARCAGEELEVASITSWVTRGGREEERKPARRRKVGRELAPELFLGFALPCLSALPERLALREVREATIPGAFGPIVRATVLREVSLPPGAKELSLSSAPDPLVRRGPIPVPPGLAPRAARVLQGSDPEEEGAEGRPLWVAWLGEGGRHLGLSLVGDWHPGTEPPPVILAASAEEAATLRASEPALAAGRALRRQANAAWVALELGQLRQAQASFRASDADRDGEADFARDLDELTRAGLLKLPLRGGVVCGHRIELRRAQDAPGERWVAVAAPLRPEDGDRHLLVAEDGVIRSSPDPIAVGSDARPPAGLEPDPRLAEKAR